MNERLSLFLLLACISLIGLTAQFVLWIVVYIRFKNSGFGEKDLQEITDMQNVEVHKS